MYLNHQKMKLAPPEAESFLTTQGYSQIQIKEIALFEIDLCSKSTTRVRFEAVKDNKHHKGYVCVEPFYPNSIHEQ